MRREQITRALELLDEIEAIFDTVRDRSFTDEVMPHVGALQLAMREELMALDRRQMALYRERAGVP